MKQNIDMKNIIKCGMVALLSASVAITFSSCNDWTEPESLDLHSPSLEEQNPELYKAYMEDLRNYKSGEHKVMFVSFNNPADYPSNRSEHLTVLPDSIDYISLNTPDNLNREIQEEIAEVREKGTKVVYSIDYASFETEWNAKQKEDPSLTEEQALAYLAERTQNMLALCDKYNYDGVIIDYTGRSLVSLPEDELAEYSARQKNFFDLVSAWKEAHGGKSLVFYGNAQYLVSDNMYLLGKCDYIILKTSLSTGSGDLSVKAYLAVQAGLDAVAGQENAQNPVPSDRFVACVETPRPEDKEMVYGYWNVTDDAGNKQLATLGAAQWAVESSADFVRKGIFILNAHNDYFDNTLVYEHIRTAIQIMNPNN